MADLFQFAFADDPVERAQGQTQFGAQPLQTFHAPGTALHVVSIFGPRNIFPSQQAAFDRVDRLNRLREIEGGGDRSSTSRARDVDDDGEAADANLDSMAVAHRSEARKGLQPVRRRHSASIEAPAERPRYAAFCVESDEPLVMRSHEMQRDRTVPTPQQTRFFVAATTRQVAAYNAEVPPLQQHLYEIIREGVPCFLYLDVEKGDEAQSTTCSSANGTATATTETNIGEGVDVQPLPSKLAEARACHMSCRLQHDETATMGVLARELLRFLRESVGLSSVAETDFTFLKSFEHRRDKKPKFSYHIILKADGGPHFSCNADVGLIVAAFVHTMYLRAQDDVGVHRALFYHGIRDESRDFVAAGAASCDAADGATSSVIRQVPVQPLQCVIDEAVYTRNRMFRCLGSCKLGKTAVLQLDSSSPSLRRPAGVASTGAEWLRQTFVSTASAEVQEGAYFMVDRESIEASFLAATTGVTGAAARAAQRAYHGALKAWSDDPDAAIGAVSRSHNPRAGAGGSHLFNGPVHQRRLAASAVPRTVTELCESLRQRSKNSGGAARIDLALVTNGDPSTADASIAVICPVVGSRYCDRVRRQHKSNGVYFIVRPSRGDFVLKCHDPDCHGHQSAPVSLSIAALVELRHAIGLAVPLSTTHEEPPTVAPVATGVGLVPSLNDLSRSSDPNALLREAHRRRVTMFVAPKTSTSQPGLDDDRDAPS